MNTSPPMDQIQAVNRSIRCFVFGLLAFIPILGLAMGALACMHARSVTRRRGNLWNPARDYVRWGRALGLVGAFASSVLFGLLLVAVVTGDFSVSNCYVHS